MCPGNPARRSEPICLAGEGIREAKQMMGIGEFAAGADHLLEEMDRAVIVLQLESLVSLLDETLGTDFHESPRTSVRTCQCLPRFRPSAGIPAPRRHARDPRLSAARPPADPGTARSVPRVPAPRR